MKNLRTDILNNRDEFAKVTSVGVFPSIHGIIIEKVYDIVHDATWESPLVAIYAELEDSRINLDKS